MLTPEDRRPDGRKIQYLRRPREWEGHDPELFGHLSQTLAAPDGKHLRHIEAPGHISRARFFGATVRDSRAERTGWTRDMLSALTGCDLLFFDPNNGIEIPSRAMGQKDSSKYIYWQELKKSWEHAKCLLDFQHFPRVKRGAYIPARVTEMTSHLADSLVLPLRSSNVLFLLAYRPADAARINLAVEHIESSWAGRVWQRNTV